MDQAALVGVLQAERRLADQVARLPDWQGARLLDQPRQVDAVDKLHCDVIGAVDLVRVIGVDDIGMGELAGRPDFTEEAANDARIGQTLGTDHLERDDALQRRLAGLEDLAHSALAEPRQDQIRPHDQLGTAALGDGIHLVSGQPTATQQLPGEGPGFLVALLHFRQLLALDSVQHRAAAQSFHEAGDGGGRHTDSLFRSSSQAHAAQL